MTMTIQDDLLAKAAHNMARVHEFFAARGSFRVPPGGEAPLRTLHDALRASLQDGLRGLLDANQVAVPAAARNASLVQLPAAELDAERVERFAAFVRQLDDWFMSMSGLVVSSRGRELLAAIVEAVVGTAAAVEGILSANQVEAERLAPTPVGADPEDQSFIAIPQPADESEPGPVRAASRPGEAATVVAEPAARPADTGPRLVFEDTEQTPVLQTFKGKVELTYQARQALDELLKQGEIKYSGYHLDKFLKKVLQWVEATPHGSVLVIRIGTLSGRTELYPSYVKKDKQR